jgi:CBS domain-containing protein
MHVRDAMSTRVVTIGPMHTLREAARVMASRRVGAAVVLDGDTSGVGILTERDVLYAIGGGQNPDTEKVADHLTSDLVFATPDMPLEDAAGLMIRGGFRHLVVLDKDDVVGIVSVRDVIRLWTAAPLSS